MCDKWYNVVMTKKCIAVVLANNKDEATKKAYGMASVSDFNDSDSHANEMSELCVELDLQLEIQKVKTG